MARKRLSTFECHSVVCMKRKAHTSADILHKLHIKHKISYKTLFYMKEYGPKSHVTSVIINQSIKTLLLASILSSMGGIYLKTIEEDLVTFLPLLILLPALTNMIGNFGTVLSSKFATLLFLGKVPKRWWESKDVHEIIVTVFFIGLISVFYIAPVAYLVGFVHGFAFSYVTFLKILAIAFISTFALISILIIIAVGGSYYIFKKKEDPNNFMIPITTSVADLGSMLLFTYLVTTLF